MSSIAPTQPLAEPPPLAAPIGYGTAAADAQGIGLNDIVRTIRQRMLSIVVTTILVYILVVAATFLIRKYAPVFPSEAVFELHPPKSGDVLFSLTEAYDARAMDTSLQTEAKKLTELGLLMDVASQAEVKATRYFEWYEADVQKCAVGLSDDLKVGPIANTNLIRITLGTRDADESRVIVQTLVNRYQARYNDEERQSMQAKVSQLKNTESNLLDELENKRGELKRVRESSDVPGMETQRTASRDFMVNLKDNLSDLDARATSLQTQLDSITGLDPSQIPITAEHKMIIDSDPQLRYYQSRVHDLDIELEAILLRLGPKHRDVLQLLERRKGFFDKEIARREELVNQVRERQVETLRQELAQTRNVQGNLQDQLVEYEAEQREIDRRLYQIQQLDDERTRLEDRITTVQERRTEAEHALADQTRVRLELVQLPRKAIKPSSPNLVAFLGGGFVLALAAGFGLAFLREFTDKAIRTPLDVARHGRVAVLGSVPLLDDEEADVEDIERAVRVAPHSLVAEAFRKVRTNLQFSGPEESHRVLLITSPSPGDGKTAVAINLAQTLANSGKRVLLIDCNFRRPAVRREFKTSRPSGLSNILIGEGKLAELVTRTEVPNLDVLSSGPLPPTPAELLGSVQMSQLLADAAKAYDQVILDGPPVLLISDSIVLATQVDGVVIVARAEDNTKGTLKRTREQLESIGARIVGAVLNGVRARAGGYFREQYREFYDYTSDETAPGDAPALPPFDEDEKPDDRRDA